MKIHRILANNRKKVFVIDSTKGTYELPYNLLPFPPTKEDPLVSVIADPELAKEAFTYKLRSGIEDSVHMDSVLYHSKDPEYLCNLMLHNLTCKALDKLKEKKISKRQLARQMKTSPQQIQRLLNTAFYGKTIDQMIKLLHVLGVTVELNFKKAA